MAKTSMTLSLKPRAIMGLGTFGVFLAYVGLKCGAPLSWFYRIRAE